MNATTTGGGAPATAAGKVGGAAGAVKGGGPEQVPTTKGGGPDGPPPSSSSRPDYSTMFEGPIEVVADMYMSTYDRDGDGELTGYETSIPLPGSKTGDCPMQTPAATPSQSMMNMWRAADGMGDRNGRVTMNELIAVLQRYDKSPAGGCPMQGGGGDGFLDRDEYAAVARELGLPHAGRVGSLPTKGGGGDTPPPPADGELPPADPDHSTHHEGSVDDTLPPDPSGDGGDEAPPVPGEHQHGDPAPSTTTDGGGGAEEPAPGNVMIVGGFDPTYGALGGASSEGTIVTGGGGSATAAAGANQILVGGIEYDPAQELDETSEEALLAEVNGFGTAADEDAAAPNAMA